MNFSVNPTPAQLRFQTSTPKLKQKYSFSKQHLRAAIMFAAEAHQHESATTVAEPRDETRLAKHLACVTATILSAAAFLESSINELYKSVIIDGEQGFSLLPMELFKEVWEVADGEKFPILKKYQTALAIASKKCFDKGTQPYQDVESLIKLRDVLMHYKPEWNDERGNHQKLEQRLSAKFPLNPYFGRNVCGSRISVLGRVVRSGLWVLPGSSPTNFAGVWKLLNAPHRI